MKVFLIVLLNLIVFFLVLKKISKKGLFLLKKHEKMAKLSHKKIKNKRIKIKGIKISKTKIFYFKKGNTIKLFSLLNSGVFVFNKLNKKKEIINSLTKTGVDAYLPIFKCECYDKTLNLGKIYLTLKLAKNLDKMGVKFNLFIFVNNNLFFRPLTKLIKYFSFKEVNIKIYNCCEINYKVLSAINYLNLNPQTNFCENKIPIEKYKNNIPFFAKVSGVYLIKNQENFKFNIFNYNSYYLNSCVEESNFYSTLSKTFDYENNATIYKLTLKNLSSIIQTYKCCFGTVFGQEGCKNTFYNIAKTKNKTTVCCDFCKPQQAQYYANFKNFKNNKIQQKNCFENVSNLSNLVTQQKNTIQNQKENYFKINENKKTNFELNKINETEKTSFNLEDDFLFNKRAHHFGNQDDGVTILGNFCEYGSNKNYFYVYKNLKLKPFESITFYFAVGSINTFYKNDYISCLAQTFENINKKYDKLTYPKVLSDNKTLNYLLNNFLPQKIIEQVIFKSNLTFDFNLFLNKSFISSLIDENCFLLKLNNNKNFSSFFLLRDNFFKVYFNLLYFFFGIWQNKKGIYLNPNKKHIVSSGAISLTDGKTKKHITIKNLKSKGEIEVNKIKYTNLSFLNFDFEGKNNISLCF